MSVDGRMPVVTHIESGCQPPGRCHIRVAVQVMADLVWIFFVYAGERQACEPVSRFEVELTRALGRSAHREAQDHGTTEGKPHGLILYPKTKDRSHEDLWLGWVWRHGSLRVIGSLSL